MPVNPHPTTAAFTSHDDQQMIGLAKAHLRLTVSDANYVRNTDLSGQFAGIFISSIEGAFDIDTGSVLPDDGTNVIIDGVGNHWIRQADTGYPPVEKLFSAASGDCVLPDDEVADVVLINRTGGGAATIVYLPDAGTRYLRGDRGGPITIVDAKFDALANPITIRAKNASGQLVMGGAETVIDSNGASIRLRPRKDGSGWY